MNVTLLNRQFDVDPLTVIVTANGAYAKIALPGREGMQFTHYVEVDERLTGMCYDVPEPPQPLTVVLTPEMAANVNHVIGVSILVRKPAPITVYHSAMRPAA